MGGGGIRREGWGQGSQIVTRGHRSWSADSLWVNRGQRPPDLKFSNGHSPNQNIIALDFQNAAVSQFFEGIRYLFTVLFHIRIVPKDN